jgi:hypothetical protein
MRIFQEIFLQKQSSKQASVACVITLAPYMCIKHATT